jgi:hypothetical protein
MLYRRERYFHYDFAVAGKRFRGSTRQTSESRARKVESRLIAKAEQSGPSAVLRRAPLLSVFGPRFLSWVNDGRGLAANTRRYYRLGWQRITETQLMGMTLDRITTEEVDGLLLSGSPSYVNQALRTLRRLLGKAVEWKVIANAPRIRLLAEPERQQVLDPESEAKLVAVGKQPLNDVLIIIQDAGMRPDESFACGSKTLTSLRGKSSIPAVRRRLLGVTFRSASEWSICFYVDAREKPKGGYFRVRGRRAVIERRWRSSFGRHVRRQVCRLPSYSTVLDMRLVRRYTREPGTWRW